MGDPKELAVIEAQFSLAPRNMTEAMEFAKMMAGSEIVPKDYKGKPGDILVAVAMGNEVGFKPLQSLQSIACINGRPSIWGDGALALVRKSGLLEEHDEDDATIALKNKIGRCRVKRKGSPPCPKDPKDPAGRCLNQKANVAAACCCQRTFSLDDANRAGLIVRAEGGNDAKGKGPWITYPGRMLMMRARSWAIRDTFPDVLKGLQVTEEVQDYEVIHTTTEGVEISKPRRKSETAASPAAPAPDASSTAAPEAAAPAPAPSVDDFLKDQPKKPEKYVDRSKLIKVLVKNSLERTGNGRTFYVLTLESSTGGTIEPSTFDTKDHDAALGLRGKFAMVGTKEVERNGKKYLNLTHIEAVPEDVDVPPPAEPDEPGSNG
jgi:hypothetical protein